METFTKSIRKSLSQLFFNLSFGMDFFPSWWWLYEPKKPELLKNK